MSTSAAAAYYPIATSHIPWGVTERTAWLKRQRRRRRRQRGYTDELIAPLAACLPLQAEMFQYGDLDYGRFGFNTYPLHAVPSRAWNTERPVVLVTGGVHGYETIGFQGALERATAWRSTGTTYRMVSISSVMSSDRRPSSSMH